jgi:hypothetical protein
VNLGRRVLVGNRSVSDVAGHPIVGSAKTGRSGAVPIPEPLAADLLEQLTRRVGPEPDALAFTSEAGGLAHHASWYRRYFRPPDPRARPPDDLRSHDLCHTYPALLIAQGAHPRAIMDRLGHSSIQMTLGTYGHRFPMLDETLTSRLDEAISESLGAGVAQERRTIESQDEAMQKKTCSSGQMPWAVRDSNPRPLARHASALPTAPTAPLGARYQ